MEKIKTDVLKQMFLDGARLIIEKEPYLTEIDSVIGDGDHGEGMKRGCEALIKILETENYVYVDELCRAVSIELIKTMGGASGIILEQCFLAVFQVWDIRNMQQHHRLQIISGMGNRRLSEEEKPDHSRKPCWMHYIRRVWK